MSESDYEDSTRAERVEKVVASSTELVFKFIHIMSDE